MITRYNNFLLLLRQCVQQTIHSDYAHWEQLKGRGWLGRRSLQFGREAVKHTWYYSQEGNPMREAIW